MARDTLIDPATGDTYVFRRNHDAESNVVRARRVTTVKPSASGYRDVRPIRVQGAKSPPTIRLQGKCADAQHAQLRRFFHLSKRQTIHFHSCTGDAYEALIAKYESTRVRTDPGPGSEGHTRTYTLDLEIITTL